MSNPSNLKYRHTVDMSSDKPMRGASSFGRRAASLRDDEACLRDSAFLAERGILSVPDLVRPGVPTEGPDVFRPASEAA